MLDSETGVYILDYRGQKHKCGVYMDIIKSKNNLPANIKDLTKFVLIGREKLVAVRAEIRAIDKIGLAQEVKEQKKGEAQDLAGALLDAEVRIGELLKDTTSRTGICNKNGEKELPEGITHKQSHFFQAMAAHPEIVEQIKAEAIENDDLPTRTEVLREIKRKELEINNNNLKAKRIKFPDNKYDVIVIDPPWPMVKIDRDITPEQTSFDYPTMSLEEIANIKIPVAADCHVWLWTTHKFLPASFQILEQWGIKYICTFVWNKHGGFQPFNLPQFNCEFALYGHTGNPQFSNLKDFKLCFEAPRGKHSEKPQEFYDMIISHTDGKRLDMFNRREINGFESWGNECR